MELLDRFALPVLYQQTSSEIINARVIVGAGSQQEGPGEDGVAHFLEHMFFKGTERRNYKEVNAILGRLGHANAYTGFDRTVYHLSYLADDFEEGFELLLEMVFQPAFPPDELQKEIGVIIEEKQACDASPTSFFSYERWANLLAGDEWHHIIGSEDSLRSMNVGRLRAFRNRWYGRGRVALSIVGNVAPERLSDAVQAYLPKPDRNALSPAEIRLDLRDHNFHHSSKQAVVAIVAPGINTDSEFESGQVPDVLCNALGGGGHSLLFDRIREEMGLCYHVSASHNSFAGLGVFNVFCMLDQENIGKLFEETKAILSRVCRDGISPDLLETAKRNYLFGRARGLERSSGIGGCNDLLFNVTAENALANSDYAGLKRSLGQISNAQIIEFARQIFGEDGENLRLISMTPE